MAYDPATLLPAYVPDPAPGKTLSAADHDVSLHQTDRTELRGLKSDFGLTAANAALLGYARLSNAAGAGLWVPSGAVADFDPIPNSDFTQWPEGTSFAAITNATYGPEGWLWSMSGAGAVTLQRSTDVPAVAALWPLQNYSLHLDVTTADASIGASDLYALQARIEGYNWAPFAQRQFTLGFWVKAAKTGVHCIAFQNSGADRSYVAEYTISAANTWEWKAVTVPASPSAGTWDYTTGLGLRIFFMLAAGTDHQTTAGAWQTGNLRSTSSQVNELDSTANDFKVAMIGPLVPGSAALPFRPRRIQQAVADAARYCWKTYADGTSPGSATPVGAIKRQVSDNATSKIISVSTTFPVRMRATPTITLYDLAGNSGKITTYNAAGAATDNVSPSTGVEAAGDTGFSVLHSGAVAGIAYHAVAKARN